MENHETLMKDGAADGVAKVKGNIITTVTPERKAEEEKAEQEDTQVDAAETPEPAVSTPLRHDTKVTLPCGRCRANRATLDFRNILEDKIVFGWLFIQ